MGCDAYLGVDDDQFSAAAKDRVEVQLGDLGQVIDECGELEQQGADGLPGDDRSPAISIEQRCAAWGKFFMAAWRGKQALTWITGAVAFVGSIGAAFTGYLSQSNFDSQWISTQAKDGLNAVGIGAYFNVLDPTQMLLWHIMMLPMIVGFLVVAHVILVRRHGIVPRFDALPPPVRRPDRRRRHRQRKPTSTVEPLTQAAGVVQ